jgi:hypothetical protein
MIATSASSNVFDIAPVLKVAHSAYRWVKNVIAAAATTITRLEIAIAFVGDFNGWFRVC